MSADVVFEVGDGGKDGEEQDEDAQEDEQPDEEAGHGLLGVRGSACGEGNVKSQ